MSNENSMGSDAPGNADGSAGPTSTDQSHIDQPIASGKSRSRVERIMVWGLIGILIVLVGTEALARYGYTKTLAAFETAITEMDESPSDNKDRVELKDFKQNILHGLALESQAEAAHQQQSVVYKWCSLFKKYELRLTVSADDDALVIAYSTGNGLGANLAADRLEPSREENGENSDTPQNAGFGGPGDAGPGAAKTPDAATVKKHMTSAQLALGDPVVNSIGMLLVPIPAGEFQMGSSDSDSDADPDEKPQHQVKLTKPFYLGVYEVTQQQYEKVMGKNPSQFKGAKNPVEQVSWTDAVEFCGRLSELPEEKAVGHVYRLPTEAEWEYACRAGTSTAFSFGDSDSQLGVYAWFIKNSGDTPHPVGQKKANPWGLCDMYGNVFEWCQDRYAPYGTEKTVSDPVGPVQGDGRLLRGGAFHDLPSVVRSAARRDYRPDYRHTLDCGFRVARTYNLSP